MIRILKRTAPALAILIIISFGAAYSQTTTHKLVREKGLKPFPVKVIKQIALPKSYHEGIYLDGKLVWVSNGMQGDIWVVDPSSGAVVETIKSIAGFTEAVTGGPDGKFYVTDWDEKKLYSAALEGGEFAALPVMSFEPSHPAGVIWNGENFFVLTWTRGLSGTKFHLLKLDGACNVLAKVVVNTIQEPSQLAWDGANLWISSWYDERVYRVDVNSWAITGFFVSPVPKTTGIAFDGSSIWLTGTSSDLYELEILTLGEGDTMKINVTSDAFEDGGVIPERYTGDGEDMSPPLSWPDIPEDAKSIALVSDDPDAPMGTWVHWVIFNIPPDVKGLAGNVPTKPQLDNGALQGMNGSRRIGYSGPYPPSGFHRYYFKVYALDTMLGLKSGVTKKDLLKAMEGHILAEGQLMGKYKRK